MALRFANKIHSIVNNVVLRSSQGLKVQQCLGEALTARLPGATTMAAPVPKTRYPLNQQDANSYIEQLKTRTFLHNVKRSSSDAVVRTFNVNVHSRAAGASRANERTTGTQRLSLYCQRFLASKAGKPKSGGGGTKGKTGGKASGGKKARATGSKRGKDGKDAKGKEEKDKGKICNKGEKKKKPICVKMPKPMGCAQFKVDNCKQQVENSCARRKYIFSDCAKRPAPYPSFSEACYEDPPLTINECKDCPWGVDKHPTFKAVPLREVGKTQKKKFHTDARRMVTLRFGETDCLTEKDIREQELQKKLYDDLNEALFGRKATARMMKLSPIPQTPATEMGQALVHIKAAAERPTPINKDHVNKLLMRSKHQLGDKRRHRIKRKKHGRCEPCCPKFPFIPPKKYDIKKKQKQFEKKERKRKRPGNTCDCMSRDEAILISCAAEGAGASNQHASTSGGSAAPVGMLCKMKKTKQVPGKVEPDKCEVLAPSPVCPKNLLDRKPYPKYRKSMKRRLKREKKLEKKRRAKRGPPKKGKKPPKKAAAGASLVEEGGIESSDVLLTEGKIEGVPQEQPHAVRPHNFYRKQRIAYCMMRPISDIACTKDTPVTKFDFKPLPEEQATEEVEYMSDMLDEEMKFEAKRVEQELLAKTMAQLDKIIMAKDRIRVTGPAVCPTKDCEKPLTKKKCPKKIKSKVCPKDLLDRRPYKKFRDGQKKHGKKGKKGRRHHKKGHKKSHKGKKRRGKKHTAGISDSEMAAMLMRTEVQQNSSHPSL